MARESCPKCGCSVYLDIDNNGWHWVHCVSCFWSEKVSEHRQVYLTGRS